MQSDNILMANLLHDLYFWMKILEVEVTGEDALVDHLHRHWLTCLAYLAAIDWGVGTLAE